MKRADICLHQSLMIQKVNGFIVRTEWQVYAEALTYRCLLSLIVWKLLLELCAVWKESDLSRQLWVHEPLSPVQQF